MLTSLKAECLYVQRQRRLLFQGLHNDVLQFRSIYVLVSLRVRHLKNLRVIAELRLSVEDHGVTYRQVL